MRECTSGAHFGDAWQFPKGLYEKFTSNFLVVHSMSLLAAGSFTRLTV
jgi:hypothetical protein